MVDQDPQQAEQELRDHGIQEQDEPRAQEDKKRPRRTTLFTVLAVVILVILILIVLWLLRGCAPSQTTSSSTSSSSGSAVADVVLANRVHTAIHPIQLGNGTLADTLVYIIDVTRQGKNVVATFRLDVSTTDLSRSAGVGAGARLAQEWETTTFARVPEITAVQVVDSNGVPVGSALRK